MDVMMEEPEGRARLKQIQDEHGSPDPFSGGLARGGDDASIA